MEEGIFAGWLKQPGEFVRAGEMVYLLEGEKAVHEIESFDAGYLCLPADSPQSGATVRVGEIIGFLLAEGEPAPASVRPAGDGPVQSPASSASSGSPSLVPLPNSSPVMNSGRATASSSPKAVPATPRAAGPAARRLARELGIDLNAVFTPDPTGRVLCEDVRRTAEFRTQIPVVEHQRRRPIATPRARRRARELGIDWTRVTGTGRHGRIRECDVLKAVPVPDLRSGVSFPEPVPTESGRLIPFTALRRVIAQRVSAGVHQAAPVTLTTKVEATALISLRERFKADPSGLIPTYNDILISLTARTLRDQPGLNACWTREGIHAYDAVHVAFAVETPGGLVAPVVRHADSLTVIQIAEQTRQLISQAREGALNSDRLSGGTFTVSNLGMFGIDAFAPILNLPQAAILGIGRIVEEPVVRGGRLEVGHTLTLSLTFDHRAIDGAPAARWLQRLCERILIQEQDR